MEISNEDQVKRQARVDSYLNIAKTNANNWAKLFKAAEQYSPIQTENQDIELIKASRNPVPK